MSQSDDKLLDSISESLSDLKENQEEMKSNQQLLMQEYQYSKSKVDEIHLSVYDPDRGIYRRLNDSLSRLENHEELIEELKENDEENQEILDSLKDDQKAMKEITGPNYEDLKQIISMQKFFRKFFWVVIPPVIAFILGHYVF